MRTAIAVFAVVVMSLPALAEYQPGNIVVVVKEAELKVDTRSVGTVDPGFSLSVQRIDGEWLWVGEGVPGWLKASNVVPLADAIAHFTAAIEREPFDARLYAARARVWTAQKNYDRAIADFNEAIRRDPREATYYGGRGWAELRKRDFNRALMIAREPSTSGWPRRTTITTVAGRWPPRETMAERSVTIRPPCG